HRALATVGGTGSNERGAARISTEPLNCDGRTRKYALNFADDEFNPPELRVLEELMPKVREGRFIVQPASAQSCGHLTMAHPELWSEHVAEFMRSIGHEGLQNSIEK